MRAIAKNGLGTGIWVTAIAQLIYMEHLISSRKDDFM